MKKTLIVSATQLSAIQHTQLWRSLTQHFSHNSPFVDYKFTTNNKDGLCQVYNRYCDDQYDIVIFAHDDITIDSVNFLSRIEKSLETYDVVGVAGGGNPQSIKSLNTQHMLWHLMTQKHEQSGIVFHPHAPYNCDVPSVFGPRPKEVILLDGLFLAVNAKKVFPKVKFDDNLKGFHHYDIKFCLDCYNNGFKLGTTNINITHQSPGLQSVTQDFIKSSDYVRNHLNDMITNESRPD